MHTIHCKLTIDLSLIISETIIQMNSSDCFSEREFIPMSTWTAEKSLKRTIFPQLKCFTANSTCWELVRATTTILREFGESLG